MKNLRALMLLLVLPLTGCIEDTPTAAKTEAALFTLLGGTVLEPSQVITLSGERAQRIFLPGGENGAEYIIIPFNAQGEEGDTVEIEIDDADVRQVVGPARASAGAPGPIAARAAERLPRNRRFHLRLREWEARHLPAAVQSPRWRQYRTRIRASRTAAARQVPQEGEIIELFAPNFFDGTPGICDNPLTRPARVAAVSEHLIIAVDTANPDPGFSEAQLEQFAQRFDGLVYPVETRFFGEPSDIDDNGRVIAFFTGVVNELTPPNAPFIVGGFFFGGDLFPRADCPQSNEGEIFYLLAPDPTGEINQNPRPTEDVARRSIAVIGHEFQHLINLSRRLFVNNAMVAEVGWLNEGLSHIAEELLFYAASDFEPRSNIGIRDLRATEEALAAVNRYQVQNLARYFTYVQNPDTTSLFGITDLSTRGAAWAFLRYAADQEEGSDQDFFFTLVNSRTNGLTNLENALGVEPLDLIQTWTVSVYSDDAPAIPDAELPRIFTQPSWNFRTVLAAFTEDESGYPLDVEPLRGGAIRLTLQEGGTAFVRLQVDQAVRAEINTTTAGGAPPADLRVSVVRIE